MREMKDSGCNYLGMIPSSWSTSRLKGYFKVSRTTGRPDATVLSLYRDYGIVPKDSRSDNHNVTSLDTSKYKFVEVGDFVVNKMKGWQGSMALSAYEGIVSPAYHVFKFTSPLLLPKYAHYLLRCRSYADEWHKLSTGLRVGQWDLHVEDFLNTRIPVPSLDEQRRIADCLDEECVEIDRAVSAAEQSIEEYRTYQNDVVKRAIVYGTCNAFKVKESGVPAIGKMNANWGLVMVKRLAVFLNGDRSDSYPSGDDIQEAGIPFITSGDLNGRYLPDVFSKYISQDKYDSLKGVKLRRGDVVFCLRGSVGKCSLNRTENCGTVASSLTVARPICCAPEWLSYALTCSSTTNQAMATAIGATSANLAANVLARTFVPLPPLSEQRLIADYLDEKCTQIDAAIAAKQAIIADLKAYKQSLIYETVTGKREV